jgi:ABC-2 type transport system permease protein
MRKPDWMVIAQRELLERVRTWWFIVVTLLGPILMLAMIVVPALLAEESKKERQRMVIVDLGDPASQVGEAFAAKAPANWTVEHAPPGTTDEELLRRIRDDEIDGFLTIPAGIDAPGAQLTATYRGGNATNQGIVGKVYQHLTAAVYTVRFAREGFSEARMAAMLAAPDISVQHTTGEDSGSSGAAVFIAGYAVMFVLYMAIVLYAVNVMRSVVQEKTNRIVEIMMAAAKPRALMLGKILGVGVVGLIQIGVWVAMALLTMHFRAEILGVFGVEAGGWPMPPLDADAIVVILAYFLLGYFFYASLYAAIGAMVSSDQEAQQAKTPVIRHLIVPRACMQLVANDPRGGAAQALTMCPFSAPILMPMRYLLGGASGLEVAVSLAILAASTWVAAWAAARIYRVGILLYGKRPSLRELGRWIRHS